MKILLVCNNAYTEGNGLCTAIHELRSRLTRSGHEARLLTVANHDPDGPQPEYPLKKFYIPFFNSIIYANGFCYAKADRKIMKEAIGWADIVHLEEAFPLQAIAVGIAHKLGKPCVASYHLFAENIMANLGMGIKNPLNRFLTWFWKITVFKHCSDIHCPSETVRQYLLDNGYRSRLHAFTNGMELPADRIIASRPQTDPYIILCIGRLAREKSQETLLDAMRYSRHAQQIQLTFAGNGPKKAKYQKIADRLVYDGVLRYKPSFGFYSHEELAEISRKAYLYIHCAWVEIEGLSCIEAIKEGAVPVIAKGPMVSTSQFALDERSIFPVRDSEALAQRIDWWIEHPEARLEMGQRYADSVKAFGAEESTSRMIQMYNLAIRG